MRDIKAGTIIGFLSLVITGALLSCATDKTPSQIENSVPQDELAYYSDTFDIMREDLWDRAGYLYREEQAQNFKLADMRFENGNLIIRTKSGSFSKGGLSSKYALKGDFDIQLDCRMDFIKGTSRRDMDQMFSMGVFDKSLKKGKISAAMIGLSMKGGTRQGYIFINCVVNGNRKKGVSRETGNFSGTFRILRTGKSISLFYRKAGESEWTKMYTFRVTDNDMLVGFQLRNFFVKRTRIQANHSISVTLDSIKINAVHEIIEEEI